MFLKKKKSRDSNRENVYKSQKGEGEILPRVAFKTPG